MVFIVAYKLLNFEALDEDDAFGIIGNKPRSGVFSNGVLSALGGK